MFNENYWSIYFLKLVTIFYFNSAGFLFTRANKCDWFYGFDRFELLHNSQFPFGTLHYYQHVL